MGTLLYDVRARSLNMYSVVLERFIYFIMKFFAAFTKKKKKNQIVVDSWVLYQSKYWRP